MKTSFIKRYIKHRFFMTPLQELQLIVHNLKETDNMCIILYEASRLYERAKRQNKALAQEAINHLRNAAMR